MIKNYFKVAWRNLWKNKSFSFINIAGLAIGMCGAILIFTWIQNELSYDQFHTNKNELYKVWNKSLPASNNPIECGDVTSAALGPAMQQQYPEIKAFARVYWPIERLVNFGDNTISTTGLDVDKPFLTMFSFPLLQGNPNHALDDIKSIVLTQKLAKKIFGDADPMGKLVKINNKNSYTVTGVMKDLPNNTQFNFEYLVSLAGSPGTKTAETQWNSNSYNTYVQLKSGVNAAAFDKKIENIILDHDKTTGEQVFLHPISKWRLYSTFENGKIAGGKITTVRLMFVIACLILLIACINFMNMSTARSEKRAKEVGVRKVIGANRSALIRQFLIESFVVTALAGLLAVIMVQLCMPAFNQLTDKKLYIDYSNPVLWCSIVGFILFTGLLAGSYPAFFLSAFRPVKVLKGTFRSPSAFISPRKVLVVVQFTVALVLIISTFIIYDQIKYAQERDNGYDRSNLVEQSLNGDLKKNYEPLKNELISSGAAIAVCKISTSISFDGSQTSGLKWGNMDPAQKQVDFSQLATTGDFVKTEGLKLVEGRDINVAEYPADTAAILINEAAVKAMGLKNPIGQTVRFGDTGPTTTIVGVIKDIVLGSVYQPTGPILISGSKNWSYSNVDFRLNPKNTVAKDLALAEKIFKKYNPVFPFQYKFVDAEYNEKFSDEVRTGSLAAVFAGLTIIISCLGLFGLAAYMAENRSKEIGIRKVLGASIMSIVQLLTKEFVALVIVSIVIASPIGWYLMNKWLQDYYYRIHISWVIFAGSGVLAVVIAIITVSFQAGKAAIANPVKSIKAE